MWKPEKCNLLQAKKVAQRNIFLQWSVLYEEEVKAISRLTKNSLANKEPISPIVSLSEWRNFFWAYFTWE